MQHKNLYTIHPSVRKYVRILTLVAVASALSKFLIFDQNTTHEKIRKATNLAQTKKYTYMNDEQHTDIVTLRTLPKVIYMLWDSGWTKAPPLQTVCLKSFQRLNADFTIVTMNLSDAENRIHRKDYYSDSSWNNASIQSKSDIIRLELLARHGGIWADATVYCKEPVSNWLTSRLLSADFLVYERKGADKASSPWISSWFIVARKNSDMIVTWRDQVRKGWAEKPLPSQVYGYFWLHRIFRNLVLSNTTFGALFHSMPFMDAALPHCSSRRKGIPPPIYKLTSGGCRAVRVKLGLPRTMKKQYN